MPNVDGRTLLAAASADDLREDAEWARDVAALHPELTEVFGLSEANRRLLRLAALAEAVSVLADDCNATVGPAYQRHSQRFGCRVQTDRVNAFEDSLLPALATLLPTPTGDTE